LHLRRLLSELPNNRQRISVYLQALADRDTERRPHSHLWQCCSDLTGYAYSLSSYLGSDNGSDTVTGSLNGATNYTQGSNVGSYGLSFNSGALASALGYGFTYATNATAITVGQRTLTTSLTGIVDKTYDQTTNATLAGSNYVLSNIYDADSVTLNDPASGTCNNANVGTGKTVSVSGLTLGGSSAGNYVLTSTAINGAVGEIDAKTLTASLTGTVDKTYDQTLTPPLPPQLQPHGSRRRRHRHAQ
jgi:hypothetical protein